MSGLAFNPDGDRGTDGLLAALRRAPLIPEHQVDQFASRPNVTRLELTPTELRVLQYLSHGLTGPMIADVTGHSAETIHSQVKDLRAKLAAKTSAHAVAIGLRDGLIC